MSAQEIFAEMAKLLADQQAAATAAAVVAAAAADARVQALLEQLAQAPRQQAP